MDRGQLLRRGEPTLQRRRVAGGTPRTDWVAIPGDSTAREESHVPSLEAEAWDIGWRRLLLSASPRCACSRNAVRGQWIARLCGRAYRLYV